MKIDANVNALHNINADFNKIPKRIFDAMHKPESKESLEGAFTDMMVDKNAFAANVKTIRTMNTVENMLLDELRE